jgi:hypothetical protein
MVNRRLFRNRGWLPACQTRQVRNLPHEVLESAFST